MVLFIIPVIVINHADEYFSFSINSQVTITKMAVLFS